MRDAVQRCGIERVRHLLHGGEHLFPCAFPRVCGDAIHRQTGFAGFVRKISRDEKRTPFLALQAGARGVCFMAQRRARVSGRSPNFARDIPMLRHKRTECADMTFDHQHRPCIDGCGAQQTLGELSQKMRGERNFQSARRVGHLSCDEIDEPLPMLPQPGSMFLASQGHRLAQCFELKTKLHFLVAKCVFPQCLSLNAREMRHQHPLGRDGVWKVHFRGIVRFEEPRVAFRQMQLLCCGHGQPACI